MEEQRFEACLNLVQALLERSSNEEVNQILKANLDLVHNGLIPTIVKFAEINAHEDELLLDRLAQALLPWATMVFSQMELDEAQNIAEVIKSFSRLIRQSFILNKNTNNLRIAITGYKEALTVFTRKTFPIQWAEIQGELGLTYLIYNDIRISDEKAEKLEQAIISFQSALEVFMREEYPLEWAKAQCYLGIAYNERIRGERAENLELAIACYHDALKVYTFGAFPQQWASTQYNLGIAYSNRIRGERAENLERSIACYHDALKVRTFDTFPQDWAVTQNNLGIAYSERIRGERAENLERSIACYHDALKVRTFDTFPQDWAMTQNNLANAYTKRIRGERAENLERAIQSSSDTLKVFTRKSFPKEWAMTQDNLGDVYRQRILGERAENLENAIRCHSDALEVFNPQVSPKQWAMAQTNLGIAYANYSRGEKEKNLEQAIRCLLDALKVFTYEAFPEQWAYAVSNLGMSYLHQIKGEKEKNLEQAIQCFSDALKVFTYEAFPEQWAQTQNNLGMAYRKLLTLKDIGNLEQSICCYLSALKVHTRQSFPEYWAMTQINLGVAHFHQYQIRKDRTEDLRAAIDYYLSALKVFTLEAFPQRYVKVQDNLGIAYKENQQFSEAYTAFANAINAVEAFREEILSGSAIEDDKKKLAEEWNQLYQNIVEVCLDLAKDEQLYYARAIEYVERSKTRNLVELILERDSKTIFPPEVVTQLKKYRDEIAKGQYQIQNSKAENPQVLAQHLQELREQRNELQNRYLPVGYGFRFDQFQPTLGQRTAIIEWYITSEKTLAFVLKPNGQELTLWQSQPEDLEALVNWVNEYLQDYYKTGKNQWRDKLDERLEQLSKILHFETILDQIPPHCDRLVLIPHRFLHLLPINALPVGESYLLDRFSQGVGYAPSCQLLQQVQQRERPDFQSLFAIQNPTEDLQFTDQEVNSILSLFPSHQVLPHSHATKAALDEAVPHLQEVDYLHFSCHGSFNPDSPFLLLADAEVSSIPTDADPKQYLKTAEGFIDLSKCLTLGNLFERGFDLNKCRLVVLSACETGLIDFGNNSDEYIGLPSGFLYAGSSSVVSSLWTVNDQSTAYLMIKFLQNLKESEDVSVAVALNQAQHWLRNITWEDLKKWSTQLDSVTSNNREIKPEIKSQVRKIVDEIEREIRAKNDTDEKIIHKKPFQSPYHWAGFTAIGDYIDNNPNTQEPYKELKDLWRDQGISICSICSNFVPVSQTFNSASNVESFITKNRKKAKPVIIELNEKYSAEEIKDKLSQIAIIGFYKSKTFRSLPTKISQENNSLTIEIEDIFTFLDPNENQPTENIPSFSTEIILFAVYCKKDK